MLQFVNQNDKEAFLGTLRFESKTKAMDPELYNELRAILREAQRASNRSRAYWDLDEGEVPLKVRKDFLHVAGKENIPLKIRRSRGSSTLELRFMGQQNTAPKKVSAEEIRQRVLDVLTASGSPLKKGEIVGPADISPFSWNLRIKELLDAGKVIAQGEKRGRLYSLT